MQVIKCDRCGKVFQTGGKVVKVAERHMRGIGVDFDLCNDCERLFMKWLKMEEKQEKIKAVSKNRTKSFDWFV